MATSERTDTSARTTKVNSEILDRLPPHNLDAERGVLGSVMLDPNLCDEVVMILRPDDFYADAHRRLFQQIVAMHDEGKRIDITLIVERLTQAGELEAVGGMAYVAEVIQSVAVAAHAVYYAEIVRNKAVLRSLIHASTSILRDAYDPTLESRELINSAEERIFAIRDNRSSDQIVSLNEVLLDAFEQIDRRLEGGAGGIPTGFTDLDNLTGGMHEGELIILAARPSMGKTALATNIADYVSVKSGMATLFVSLEMARLELAPAHALRPRQDQRAEVPRRVSFGGGPGQIGRGLHRAEQSRALYRRHPQPHGDRGRRGRTAAQAEGQPGHDRDRLPPVDRAGKRPGPASGAGCQNRTAAQGNGPRTFRARPLPGPVESASGTAIAARN